MKKVIVQSSFLSLVFLGLAACSSAPIDSTQTNDYFNEHLVLVDSLSNSAVVQTPKLKFERVFSDFKTTMTEANLRELYAEELYFNDTLVTVNTVNDLIAYMEKTAENATQATVEITDVAKSETDYYLRWTMDMTFVVRGKEVRSKSIGMTQLRFNEQGKVVFHQDYWDSANAFYQHLPIVGGMVKRVKGMMH